MVGGSWGATLALAYGQVHTDRVEAMILRALFLGTKKEIDWAFLNAPLKLYVPWKVVTNFLPVNLDATKQDHAGARLRAWTIDIL